MPTRMIDSISDIVCNSLEAFTIHNILDVYVYGCPFFDYF